MTPALPRAVLFWTAGDAGLDLAIPGQGLVGVVELVGGSRDARPGAADREDARARSCSARLAHGPHVLVDPGGGESEPPGALTVQVKVAVPDAGVGSVAVTVDACRGCPRRRSRRSCR